MRQQSTLAGRALYAAWTPHLLHHPPHAGGTPDAAGVAAFLAHPCGSCQTWPPAVTPRRRADHHGERRAGGPEPSPYLQVDTALYAGRSGGALRQTRTGPPPRAVAA